MIPQGKLTPKPRSTQNQNKGLLINMDGENEIFMMKKTHPKWLIESDGTKK